MEIKILGTNCARCRSLEKLVRMVVDETGIEARISKVEEIMDIMQYGIMTTPALVVDGRIVLKGRVPSAKELKSILVK